MRRRLRTAACVSALALLGACGDSGTGTGNENENENNQNNNSAAQCGNGQLDPGEECDDGADNSDISPDACRTDCRLPWCGDGVQDTGEGCDDGNDENLDGCLTASTDATDTCVPNVCGDGVVNRALTGEGLQVEACDDGVNDGVRCAPGCQQDLTLCGNASLDQGEDCDDGQQNSDTTPNACRLHCHLPVCGDGVHDDGTEECDSGAANGVSPSACLADCTLTTCGDGYVGGSEECDAGAQNSDVTPDACRSSCLAPACGDGVVDTGEGCDDGGLNSDSAPDACRTSCQPASCGDGVLDAGEVCDDGAQNGQTSCRVDCTLESCGDGVLDAGEQCDDGVANSNTAPNACRTNCVLTTCGDGYLGGSEACDGSLFGGATCATAGHGGGTLACTAGCALDTAGCFEYGDHLCERSKGESYNASYPLDCGFIAVDGGQNHTCAIRLDGSAACWGRNLRGQIGDGTNTNRLSPRAVSLPAGVHIGSDPQPIITTGLSYSCALRELASGNELRCWGSNDYGQLGDGTTTESNLPVRSAASAGELTFVNAGGNHTCAIPRSSGLAPKVKCWGRNNHGQLGDGTTTQRQNPVEVNFAQYGVQGLGLGVDHTCAGLGSSASLYCWGSNSDGQLGDTTTTDRHLPVAITANGGGGSITTANGFGGYFTITTDGSKRWGSNDFGQLALGTLGDFTAPVSIIFGSYDVIELGGAHTCAVKNARVYCWGQNDYGQLGDGTTTDSNGPLEIMTLGTNETVSLGLGQKHTCIVRGNGSVQCWGRNSYGQVGIGSTNPGTVTTPQSVNMP